MSHLAPIALFVYNRPLHTQKTVKAILNNALSRNSHLYIYSDAPKTQEDQEKVLEVRSYIRTIQGFKKTEIIEREQNFGLANNIIDGVTKIVNQYGKIIVLEDDIVVSPVFLDYMNSALNYYQKTSRVWCINAYCLPTSYPLNMNYFFTRELNCWGWGTWSDRWKYYKKDTHWALDNFSKSEIRYLNFNSIHKYWKQLLLNHQKKIDTWFVFFYLSSIKQDGLALSPTKSYITQIGFDGSGKHCGKLEDIFLNAPFTSINTKVDKNFPQEIIESQTAMTITRKYYYKIRILLMIAKIKKKLGLLKGY